MRKLFNVAGPCNYIDYYMVPMVARHPEVVNLIDEKRYFTIHAARQTGKTTLVQELVQKINSEGKYYALYCSLEAASIFSDPKDGIPEILGVMQSAIKYSKLPNKETFGKGLNTEKISNLISDAIKDFCSQLDKPFVLFIDEIDSLEDGTLVAFLRQLRDGYITRSSVPFPQSIVLVGMRNIRDYKSKLREAKDTLGSASPFNIITKSLTINAFTPAEIESLYRQHTDATGQVFEPEVITKVYEQTNGQPWLVNAIAREIVEDILKKDYSKVVKVEMVGVAIQNIILRRDTHIDSLLDKLNEERVQRIIEPIILGKKSSIRLSDNDTQYCLNLGLIRNENGIFKPFNPIYSEVIIRTLNYDTQHDLINFVKNAWFTPNGDIDMNGLLKEFQNFWRLHSGMWLEKYDYKEAAPHLVLNAFLQRVINGGGRVEREYAYGRDRMDLCVIYNQKKYPIELKVLYDKNTIPEGIIQLSEYMDGLGERIGWLVVFDRNPNKKWKDKIYWKTEERNSLIIHILGA